MSTYPEEFLPRKHNHVTRDIKPRGECPSCDEWYHFNDARNRIKGVLAPCPYCNNPMGSAPGALCTQPQNHKARPKNHGGVGSPPA